MVSPTQYYNLNENSQRINHLESNGKEHTAGSVHCHALIKSILTYDGKDSVC